MCCNLGDVTMEVTASIRFEIVCSNSVCSGISVLCFKKDKHGILEEVTIENKKKKVKKKDFIRHCPGPEKN